MSGIAALLSSDLASKRIFLFEGCSELIYLAYLGELLQQLRKPDMLLVEHVCSKDCSRRLLFDKLSSLSCFEKIFFTYDDPGFPISEVGKIENYLCLYSQERLKQYCTRDDLLIISFSGDYSTLRDLIRYYAEKYSLNFDREAVTFLIQHLKKNSFAIDKEMLKYKHCFGAKRIMLEDVLKLCEPTSPSVNKFCQDLLTSESNTLFDGLYNFCDSEVMLVIRCLIKYCDAVIEITNAIKHKFSKDEIIQSLRKKQFYDLQMIEHVLQDRCSLPRVRLMLLELPVLEAKYKLSARKSFSLLLAGLIDILARTNLK